MRHFARRLRQQQTFVRYPRKHATATPFLHDGTEIHVGVETQQGQLKPTLATRFPMTRTAVAAKASEHGLDVVLEIHLRVCSTERPALAGQTQQSANQDVDT